MTPTFNEIIESLRQVLPSPSPLDPLVLQSILLCLVAGEKHLILHAPAQDVRLVVRVVVWIFSVIFEFPTHKLKIKPRQVPLDPSAPTNPHIPFLRSLFLPPQQEGQDDQHDSTHPHSNVKHPRPRYPKPRHNSKPLYGHDTPPLTPSPILSPFGDSHPHHPHNNHASKKRSKLNQTSVVGRELPRALVVSGLHHASTLSQCALAKVLMDKRVVLDVSEGTMKPAPEGDGVWNLPDGFIVVYVCPWDTRERPVIHKTLLDKFAMSATVILRQSARRALEAISSSPIIPPHTPSISSKAPSGSRTLTDPLLRPRVQEYSDTTAASQPLLPIPSRLLATLHKNWTRTTITPNLSLYLSDMFSAIRHHPELDGTFLTVRSMNDAVDLAKAYKVLGLNLAGTELIRSTAREMRNLQENEEVNFTGKGKQKQQGTEDSGLFSPLVYDDRSSTSPLLLRGHYAQSQGGYQSGPSQESFNPQTIISPPYPEVQEVEEEEWGISEADIARIVPRVVTHRLRMRDGPQDQILASLRYGSLFELEQDGEGETGHEVRRTIKSILVEVLAEV
ncbi:hypothetical protein BDN72DRAFT_834044 [Pluteus cervinus]|uniref:Uncharacterized protein n=1 Tax=Pluteus cervinus TaxID=181527 RepID=A0ACD3B8S4_9AGAR|nr:hypothetical protein BDN72DRAFT_834044 [Pluteus cervinus]